MTRGEEQNSWQNLIEKYLAKTITKAELDRLLEMVTEQDQLEGLDLVLKAHWEQVEAAGAITDRAWDYKLAVLLRSAPEAEPVSTPVVSFFKKAWFRYAAAAVLILCIGGYLWYQSSMPSNNRVTKDQLVSKLDIRPGKNRALLMLADGSTIDLDSSKNGRLTEQDGAVVNKLDGQLVYESKQQARGALQYNTLVTPRGGQYQLTLPDGSKVWLNAASSIRYPVVFNVTERIVEISGEAYFEVRPSTARPSTALRTGQRIPFKVKVNEETAIEVLGTSFNVNAYHDEPSIKTTLLTGKVKISKGGMSGVLLPGQQADVNSMIRISNEVDLEQVMAWKNGAFDINGKKLDEVMRQLARWYDVTVIYEGKIPDKLFGGEIGRQLNLSQCLEVLEKMGVTFRIEEGRKLVVIP